MRDLREGMGGMNESKAEIHIGGRVAWCSNDVRTQPDAVHRGRALVRTTGKVEIAIVVGYDADEPTRANLYVNGGRVSVERATAAFDEVDGRKTCLTSMTVDVGALVVTDPDALEPILSQATFGISALKALLATLPPCARCVRERQEKPEDYVGHETPWPATRKTEGGLICNVHALSTGFHEPLPYAPVVEAIEARLRQPIFYGPREIAAAKEPT